MMVVHKINYNFMAILRQTNKPFKYFKLFCFTFYLVRYTSANHVKSIA